MFNKSLIIFFIFGIIMGCQEKGLNLCITFDQVAGLKENERVIFDQNHIGRVQSVQYEKIGYFTVCVEIKRAFADAVTEHARFFIIPDPEDNIAKAIEMIQVKKGGKPLENGVTVKGTIRFSALLDRTMYAFGKGLEDLEQQFDELNEQLQDLPESETYKDLKKELERLSEEIRRAGEEARKKMEKEVLPRLREELERLRERLFELQKNKEEEELLGV